MLAVLKIVTRTEHAVLHRHVVKHTCVLFVV